MAPYVHNPNPNPVVRALRKLYNPLGFKKGYNAVLAFIFLGGLLGFALARLSFLNISGSAKSSYKNSGAPGEYYWIGKSDYHRIGLLLHLAAILPASLLAIFQFIPVIRHKAIFVHRVNGYAIYLLLLVSTAGAMMISRRAFGGDMGTQSYLGFLAIITVGSCVMAYYNIKWLQIDQHRAWMIRVWFYAGSIITLRIIQAISATILTTIGSYWYTIICGQIASSSSAAFMNSFPECAADGEGAHISVNAGLNSLPGAIAALEMTFGMSGWLALALHAIGVELYLLLTPAESERLRQVSYERQIARGFKRPGSTGLVADRFGDAEEWTRKGNKGAEAGLMTRDSESEIQVAKPDPIVVV